MAALPKNILVWLLINILLNETNLPEYSKMDLVPFLGKDFRLLPGQGLDGPVVLKDGELDSLQLGVKPDCELRLASPIRDSGKCVNLK